ncbi:hypothetical protein DFS34DRAFT_663855 [Phlyctochytrium arcticum]|nr:hypothetical protein DFS34DRAFT_663855 [Phlyctochytrium arcticum]
MPPRVTLDSTPNHNDPKHQNNNCYKCKGAGHMSWNCPGRWHRDICHATADHKTEGHDLQMRINAQRAARQQQFAHVFSGFGGGHSADEDAASTDSRVAIGSVRSNVQIDDSTRYLGVCYLARSDSCATILCTNNSKVHAIGNGSVVLHNPEHNHRLHIHDTLHVPGLGYNLISSIRLTMQQPVYVHQQGNWFKIRGVTDHQVLLKGYVDKDTQLPTFDALLWRPPLTPPKQRMPKRAKTVQSFTVPILLPCNYVYT